jgi:hypothetical protein
MRSGVFHPKRSEKIRNWLGKYLRDQSLFGLGIDLGALKEDAPSLIPPANMLDFMGQVIERLSDTGVKGVFLILDEINGVTSDPRFANFVKGLMDSNALLQKPLPLLLMLCGVEERRREMIRKHQPVERVFDIIEIGALSDEEMREFFTRTFQSVQMSIDNDALDLFTLYSAGFPKIMHLIGDAAYWSDRDGKVDDADATDSVILAADEVGKKYVDQQVYNALQSEDYRAILNKIGQMSPHTMSFRKSDVASRLTTSQRGKLNNFLQKMKKLNVLRSGDVRGEYVFNMRMVRLYIWMRARLNTGSRPQML